jgi:site-specific DNA recombinase
MKAAIYSRKSKFTGKGESVENQIQLCKEHGMKYLGINDSDYIIYEDEGFSGGNTNRPQFQRMLKDAKTKKFDVLICYRLDRISRNVSDFSQLIKDLNKYNVNFISIREQFDTTTPMGRAMMYIASVFSQLERETIAERIKDNMMQLAKTGRWLGGITPTGYRSEAVVTIEPDGKERKMFKLAPIPEELKLVKLIYNKYVSFKSITQVEKYLIENSISTKNSLDFQRYSLRYILSNPVYAIGDMSLYNYLTEKNYDICSMAEEFNGINGLTGYNKTKQDKENHSDRYRDSSEWILAVGMHAGIIPSKIWIEAQKLLEHNKSKSYRKVKSSQSLLSGILHCRTCGSFMRPKAMQRTNAQGEQVFYYMCEMKEKSRKSRCDIPNINGNVLDHSMLKELKNIISKNEPVFEEILDEKAFIETTKDVLQSERDALQIKVVELDLAIQNLVTAIARGKKDEVLNIIFNSVEKLTKEKENIKKRLSELQNVEKAPRLNELNLVMIAQGLGTLNDSAWDLMNVSNKRRMIKSVVEKIIWDGKKLDMILFGSNCIEVPQKEFHKPPESLNGRQMFPQCEDGK